MLFDNATPRHGIWTIMLALACSAVVSVHPAWPPTTPPSPVAPPSTVPDNEWREVATRWMNVNAVSGGQALGAEDQWVGGESDEARRALVERRRLNSCASFVQGSTFNVVPANCALGSTIEVNEGEEMRVKGLDSVDHPVLDRGGAANGETSVYDRHFVLNGASKLTLLNLKLIGAWVGNTCSGSCQSRDDGICGYCQYVSPFCVEWCDDYIYFSLV